MKLVVTALGIVGVMAMTVFAPAAMADEGDMTAKLQKMVGELSVEQQAALYLLLSELSGKAAPSEAAAAAPASPKEGVMAAVKGWEDGMLKQDIDTIMAVISDEFDHYEYGDKENLKNFIEQAVDMGYLEGVEIDDSEAEIEEDGDEFIVYPVEVEAAFGSATFEFTVKKEGDAYKIVSMEIEGI